MHLPCVLLVSALLQRGTPCARCVARSMLHMSGAAGSAAGGGGDLAGGNDEQRNQQLAALRKAFLSPDATGVPSEEVDSQGMAGDVRKLGLLADTPLCRFSWCVLPHHQMTLNIWQPQYTLMFSKLLGEPGPHYYAHVLLPGGADSLGQPGYELQPGSKAALTGTLMRIVYAQREADSRLAIVVQGLSRCVVVRPTQELPYSRGDVQILPDAESLIAAARHASRLWATTMASMRRQMVAAVAAAESEALFAYDAVRLSIDSGGTLAPLNQFNDSTAAADVMKSALQQSALEKTLREASSVDVPSGLFNGSMVLDALDAAIAQVEDEDEDDATEEAEALKLLELQCWIELDDLLQVLRALTVQTGSTVPVPSQLLGLLPPPPSSGWPAGFELGKIAARMEQEYNKLREAEASVSDAEEGNEPRARSFVPLHSDYPAHRRAERLSYVLFAIIGDQKIGVNSFNGSPYQELLEAPSTADRLRLALRRLREIKGRLEDD